jgi:deazaflavin-dependent oxidoreductase (nitroreductase family)
MFEGTPLLLLHTTGARTGRERVNPLGYLRAGERLVIFAANGGARTNPDWYYNLVANPEVTVEVGSETKTGVATVLSGDERDRLFAEEARRHPALGEYQERTSRIIPVIAIAPRG